MNDNCQDCDNCRNRASPKCLLNRGLPFGSIPVQACTVYHPATFARLCKDCPPRIAKACRYIFTHWWHEKSWGGVGCRHPIDDYANRHFPDPATLPPPPPPLE